MGSLGLVELEEEHEVDGMNLDGLLIFNGAREVRGNKRKGRREQKGKMEVNSSDGLFISYLVERIMGFTVWSFISRN